MPSWQCKGAHIKETWATLAATGITGYRVHLCTAPCGTAILVYEGSRRARPATLTADRTGITEH